MKANETLAIFLRAKKAALGTLPKAQENELNLLQGGDLNGSSKPSE